MTTVKNPNSDNTQYNGVNDSPQINIFILVVGGVLVINSMFAKWFFYQDYPIRSTLSAVAGAVLLSLPILATAIRDIKKGKYLMNELVALALLAAFVMEKFQEAGIIAFFMLIAIAIEEKTASGAKTSISQLVKLTPDIARRIDPQTGDEVEVTRSTLIVGDIIRIRPGENFPTDGTVRFGSSTVDQSSITGESLPADKYESGSVYAGTVNLTGALDIEVTEVGKDTTLGKVRALIESAEKSRFKFVRSVDSYLVYYTPTIVMVAAVVWFFSHDLMRVVLILVIACPCALILATPTAAVAAIATAARSGILIKDVVQIELISRIRTVVFDKTGTLTAGTLEVARLQPNKDVALADLVAVAVSVESESNHPVATALRKLARESNVSWAKPTEINEIAGKGIIARCDEDTYYVGRTAWFKELEINIDTSVNADEGRNPHGMSIVYVARNKEILGWIGLRDTVRTSARSAIEDLRTLGMSHCSMVTGDNYAAAELVAKEVGIDTFVGDCLPESKVKYVEDMRSRGGPVVFVGDGVNDAPALCAGDVGVAMGAMGSDIAVNSASIALMNNNLRLIPFLIRLSRKTQSIINLNLIFGATIIALGLLLFILGDDIFNRLAVNVDIRASVITSLVAVILQIVGAVAVLLNSARLIHFADTAIR